MPSNTFRRQWLSWQLSWDRAPVFSEWPSGGDTSRMSISRLRTTTWNSKLSWPKSRDWGDPKMSYNKPQVKVLGVMLDSKLNFNHHVSALCTKAARQLNALARISRFLSTSSRMIIYNSFINSNFNYCPIVWHFCGKKNGDKIEKFKSELLG